MNKQIIKTIIGEKQKEIEELKLLSRSNLFEDNSNYVLKKMVSLQLKLSQYGNG